MVRTAVWCCLCVTLAVTASVHAAPEGTADEESRFAELAGKLAKPVKLEAGFINTPLKDALEFLSEQYQLPMLVDTEAFKAEGIQEVEAAPLRLQKMVGVRLSAVLQLSLAQVNGAYLVRPDYVEVTTAQRAAAEALGTNQPPDRLTVPLVQARFDKRPLQEALRELAASTGGTVILDTHRANEKVKVPITATLRNVPLDTAVRLLADLAGLKLVRLESVLYVTTKENALDLKDDPSPRDPGQPGPAPRAR
jgi:hypothetical protein